MLGLGAEESLDVLQRALLSTGLDASLQRSPTPDQLLRALQRAAGEPGSWAAGLKGPCSHWRCCWAVVRFHNCCCSSGRLSEQPSLHTCEPEHVSGAARQAHQFRPRDRGVRTAAMLNAQKSPRAATRLAIARVMGTAAQTALGRTRQRATQAQATRAAVTRSCWMRSWSMLKSRPRHKVPTASRCRASSRIACVRCWTKVLCSGCLACCFPCCWQQKTMQCCAARFAKSVLFTQRRAC